MVTQTCSKIAGLFNLDKDKKANRHRLGFLVTIQGHDEWLYTAKVWGSNTLLLDPSFTPSAYTLTHTFAMAMLQCTMRNTVHTTCVTVCVAMCDCLGARHS